MIAFGERKMGEQSVKLCYFSQQTLYNCIVQTRSWQISVKGQSVNILSFAGHMVDLLQLLNYGLTKAARDIPKQMDIAVFQ